MGNAFVANFVQGIVECEVFLMTPKVLFVCFGACLSRRLLKVTWFWFSSSHSVRVGLIKRSACLRIRSSRRLSMFMLFIGRNVMHCFNGSDTDLDIKSIITVRRSDNPSSTNTDLILLQFNLIINKSSPWLYVATETCYCKSNVWRTPWIT